MKVLAHSAQLRKGIPEQTYQEHITGVFRRAHTNLYEMLKYAQEALADIFRPIVLWAACFHDLGKLDEENQEVLQGKKQAKRLPVYHEDAGVAYLKNEEKKLEAALLVYFHHRGLCSIPKENAQMFPYRDIRVREKTDPKLSRYLAIHRNEVTVELEKSKHYYLADGLSRRLALSCLVDADHSDSAGYQKPDYQTRWQERLAKLEYYVRNIYEENEKSERNELRNKIFYACKNRDTFNSIYYCDSPVGTGKTTAVMAHLLQTAIQKNLRHIIVVLPFTNIITQSVRTYRKALVLEDEDPEAVVVEHDHQADFSSYEARELATLWNAPIIVTTAVQFFETLGSNKTARLRKLHELPGSGIFIDESHAAIPIWLWPQSWIWLQKLRKEWGCHLILASGTTMKFWEIDDFLKTQEKEPVPELVPENLRNQANKYEQNRIEFKINLNKSENNTPIAFQKIDDLIDFVISKEGPRIIILNTVFSTAYLANAMRKRKLDVLHLSTALSPRDREPIINEIYRRLERDKCTQEFRYQSDWTLAATSCAEAGLNFSFRSGFAELRSVSSYLQISGRVNREGEYNDSEMWGFVLNDPNLNSHPGFKTSQKVFRQLIKLNLINKLSITELVTETIRRELKEDYSEKTEKIQEYERNHEYPEVAEMCKIIDSDTRLVVINPDITRKLENGEKVNSIDLIKNSVQIWAPKINDLRLKPVNGYNEIFKWPEDGYDPKFLGYMKMVLDFEATKKDVLIPE
jgi:CRISPR-associated endonuclease/helicase Cas3